MLQMFVLEGTGVIWIPALAFLVAAPRLLRLRRRPAMHQVPCAKGGVGILKACVEEFK